MKARIVIPLALMGLFSVGTAYAMTNRLQAEENLLVEADNGNAADMTKLNAMSKSGNAMAQSLFGLYWLEAKKDYAKANFWFEKVAAQGNAAAETNLGSAYAKGQGVPQDYAKANSWYEKAVAQGLPVAEYNLGVAYAKGYGVPQDTMTAITWWKIAAAQGGHTGREAQQNINMALWQNALH